MIKESSFRRFMYQNDREKAELYYAKLANFLSRESTKDLMKKSRRKRSEGLTLSVLKIGWRSQVGRRVVHKTKKIGSKNCIYHVKTNILKNPQSTKKTLSDSIYQATSAH